MRLPSLPSPYTSVLSRSLQTPTPVRCETRSGTAVVHSTALPAHDSTASKPLAQRRKPPPLLLRPTPLHVAPSTAHICRESQFCLLRILGCNETLALGRRYSPYETLALGRCYRLCKTLTLDYEAQTRIRPVSDTNTDTKIQLNLKI